MSFKRRNQRQRNLPKPGSVKVNLSDIDYKNPEFLRQFLNPRLKIMPRVLTGLSAKAQRKITREIKKSRIMGLLPFTDRHAI